MFYLINQMGKWLARKNNQGSLWNLSILAPRYWGTINILVYTLEIRNKSPSWYRNLCEKGFMLNTRKHILIQCSKRTHWKIVSKMYWRNSTQTQVMKRCSKRTHWKIVSKMYWRNSTQTQVMKRGLIKWCCKMTKFGPIKSWDGWTCHLKCL